ncbi:MAG: glycosyltransferase family 61 protein [Chroococcidiopsidaceae cyanobacterium CP_BM_ER_R8_30]|nr:glycosyltransferase family 61 protein [Chroococcidiopsidaceae cyanobacterium CP_BM_ER_R8_30]
MALGFRAKMALFRVTSPWLFGQLRKQGWPFSRIIDRDEAARKQLISYYCVKFNSEQVDSSIRPIHSGRSEVELYCKQFEQIAPTLLPEAGVVELSNVSVHMPTCVHRCRGLMLRDAFIDIGLLANLKYVAPFLTIPLRRQRKVTDAVLLGLPNMQNYYHWLIEIMPRIQLIENDSRYANLPWLLPKDSPRFVKMIIDTAGYSDHVCYLEQGVYRFERLIIPTVMSVGSGPNHPNELNWLRKKFIPNTPPQATRRLFISRRDTPQRFITNESEALQRLVPLGFELVCPGSLDFANQVKIFAEAQIVVGPHGAGLSNVVFAPANTGLVEVFARNQLDNFYNCKFFSQIAKLRHMTYGVVIGEPEGFGISVDIDELEETVRRVITALEQK